MLLSIVMSYDEDVPDVCDFQAFGCLEQLLTWRWQHSHVLLASGLSMNYVTSSTPANYDAVTC